jgi:class 3 adenylate cyclase
MNQARQVAVLFADVGDNAKLFEIEGGKPTGQAIARCIDQLRQSVECSGGRVVKTIGDGVIALFPTSDAAAIAASDIQYAIDALPPVGATKLGVRIGFHCGPVIQRDDDILGDTVNIAARLVEQAVRSQIITSRETSDRLGPEFRSFKRPLYLIHLKGKAEDVELCELIWNDAADLTTPFTKRVNAIPETLELCLKYRERDIILRRHDESITLGRDLDCGLPIANDFVSRQHCVIERRLDKFILVDQSANGTYVTAEGRSEVLLQREEFMLGKHGWITFGHPRAEAAEVVEYFCDEE